MILVFKFLIFSYYFTSGRACFCHICRTVNNSPVTFLVEPRRFSSSETRSPCIGGSNSASTWGFSGVPEQACSTHCFTRISVSYEGDIKIRTRRNLKSSSILIERGCNTVQKDAIKTLSYCNWKSKGKEYTTNCTFFCVTSKCNSQNVYNLLINGSAERYVPQCRRCISDVHSFNDSCVSQGNQENTKVICFGMCFYIVHITLDDKVFVRRDCLVDYNGYFLFEEKASLGLYGLWTFYTCRSAPHNICNNDNEIITLTKYFDYSNYTKVMRHRNYKSRSVLCLSCTSERRTGDQQSDCEFSHVGLMFDMVPCEGGCRANYVTREDQIQISRGCLANSDEEEDEDEIEDDDGTNSDYVHPYEDFTTDDQQKSMNLSLVCYGCDRAYEMIKSTQKFSNISETQNNMNSELKCRELCNIRGEDICRGFSFNSANKECYLSGDGLVVARTSNIPNPGSEISSMDTSLSYKEHADEGTVMQKAHHKLDAGRFRSKGDIVSYVLDGKLREKCKYQCRLKCSRTYICNNWTLAQIKEKWVQFLTNFNREIPQFMKFKDNLISQDAYNQSIDHIYNIEMFRQINKQKETLLIDSRPKIPLYKSSLGSLKMPRGYVMGSYLPRTLIRCGAGCGMKFADKKDGVFKTGKGFKISKTKILFSLFKKTKSIIAIGGVAAGGFALYQFWGPISALFRGIGKVADMVLPEAKKTKPKTVPTTVKTTVVYLTPSDPKKEVPTVTILKITTTPTPGIFVLPGGNDVNNEDASLIPYQTSTDSYDPQTSRKIPPPALQPNFNNDGNGKTIINNNELSNINSTKTDDEKKFEVSINHILVGLGVLVGLILIHSRCSGKSSRVPEGRASSELDSTLNSEEDERLADIEADRIADRMHSRRMDAMKASRSAMSRHATLGSTMSRHGSRGTSMSRHATLGSTMSRQAAISRQPTMPTGAPTSTVPGYPYVGFGLPSMPVGLPSMGPGYLPMRPGQGSQHGNQLNNVKSEESMI